MEIKKIIILFLILILFYFILNFQFGQALEINNIVSDSSDNKKEINIWGWDKSLEKAFIEYEKSHDNIHFRFTYIPQESLRQKLRLTIASSGKLPDICIINNENLPEFRDLDMWQNLQQEPFCIDENDLLDYMISDIQNSNGEIIGVPYDVSTAGLAYRKSLAKKVLGVDYPNDIAITFKSWADIISKGTILKEKFGDELFLFAGIEDPGMILFEQTSEPYVKDGKLYEPNRFYNYFKVLISMRDNGLLGKASQWSPEWYDSYKDDCYLFYPCAIWSPQLGLFNSGDKESDWGLTMPPKGSFEWNGSTWMILKSSQNKEIAWDFMKEFLLSYGGARFNKNKTNGVFINYKPAYQLEEYRSLYQKDFGNQNIGMVYFNQLLPNIYKFKKTEYTAMIKKLYMNTLNAIIHDETLDTDKAYNYLMELIRKNIPQILEDEVD